MLGHQMVLGRALLCVYASPTVFDRNGCTVYI